MVGGSPLSKSNEKAPEKEYDDETLDKGINDLIQSGAASENFFLALEKKI